MYSLAFIGAGRMATAIAAGLVQKNVFAPSSLIAFDPVKEAGENFKATSCVDCVSSLEELSFKDIEAVLIAVKPQVIKTALAPIANFLQDKLVISIAAGVPISTLATIIGHNRIIRVMPNTPALVGMGASAFSPGEGATGEDVQLVEKIFASVGSATCVKEPDLDAVTGLSGSGPAYVFEFIKALADGGVAEGLTRAAALELAVQTVLGSAQMVKETAMHPAVLCDQVTSPGGTTSRGLEQLAQNAFAGTVIKAVRAASDRSRQLGKM